jgi:hypothetical protein
MMLQGDGRMIFRLRCCITLHRVAWAAIFGKTKCAAVGAALAGLNMRVAWWTDSSQRQFTILAGRVGRRAANSGAPPQSGFVS